VHKINGNCVQPKRKKEKKKKNENQILNRNTLIAKQQMH